MNICSKKVHNNYIMSMAVFPSGNNISVSKDKSIKIYDNRLNILQYIQNAHEDLIGCANIKDENNFVTCSNDKNIKTWIKKENQFEINQIIENAHNQIIRKVIYYLDNKLISCSYDSTIKIWEEKNNNYQNIFTLNHSKEVFSILLLKDKNILVSSGNDRTSFWNLNKNELIINFNDTLCNSGNALCRINEDKIIVQGKNHSLKVISITQKKIIYEIEYYLNSWGIFSIENKGIFLVGGNSKDIRIYRNDNYECIQIIKNAIYSNILGFIELKNGNVASYGWDQIIKIWSF